LTVSRILFNTPSHCNCGPKAVTVPGKPERKRGEEKEEKEEKGIRRERG
jgi:hypothetical protein